MIEGVYYTSSKLWIGAGATRRKSISRSYWYAREVFNSQVEVQLLTSNLTPIGEKKLVDLDTFTRDYILDPDLVAVSAKSTSITVERDDAVLADRNDAMVPVKTPQAVRAELLKKEQQVTKSFDRGISLLNSGHTVQARKLLVSLPDQDVNWEQDHKHMFNGFGTKLRKHQEPEIALKHYLKAAELSPEDENLCYNIARVYYDLNKGADCKRWLQRALKINSDLIPAQKFLQAFDNT